MKKNLKESNKKRNSLQSVDAICRGNNQPSEKKYDEKVMPSFMFVDGIALITLVITVLIIVILASVSINLALMNNGLFSKTKEAKVKFNYESIGEEIEIAVLTSRLSGKNDTSINTTILENELKETCEITDITKSGSNGSLPWIVTKDGFKYLISETGEITQYEESESQPSAVSDDDDDLPEGVIRVTAEQIAANPNEYYGKQVYNYKVSEDDTNVYRIFYVDDEKNVNDSTKGYFGDALNTVYLKADFSDEIYYLPTTYESNTKIRTMNPLWSNGATSAYNSITRGNSESSWGDNEKAAAYLCSPVNNSNYETTSLQWKDYYDSTMAEYVIGGPSVEMYLKSYNKVKAYEKALASSAKNVLEAKYNSSGTPGYIYKINGKQSTVSYSDYNTGTDCLDVTTTYNNMYCGRSGNKGNFGKNYNVYGWWLSSPSSYYSSTVCAICIYNADLDSSNCSSTYYAISPIISLKSNTAIEIYI